jgi:hypothetical protein
MDIEDPLFLTGTNNRLRQREHIPKGKSLADDDSSLSFQNMSSHADEIFSSVGIWLRSHPI